MVVSFGKKNRDSRESERGFVLQLPHRIYTARICKHNLGLSQADGFILIEWNYD
jgi:hypothetical protein